MKPSQTLTPGAQAAVAAMILLGWIGGSLIVAHSGFATSPKRGGLSVFVPAPEAYGLAALLYAMSAIGLLALLRHHKVSGFAMGLVFVLYGMAAWALTAVLGPG
jgi:hypothetical protein